MGFRYFIMLKNREIFRFTVPKAEFQFSIQLTSEGLAQTSFIFTCEVFGSQRHGIAFRSVIDRPFFYRGSLFSRSGNQCANRLPSVRSLEIQTVGRQRSLIPLLVWYAVLFGDSCSSAYSDMRIYCEVSYSVPSLDYAGNVSLIAPEIWVDHTFYLWFVLIDILQRTDDQEVRITE